MGRIQYWGGFLNENFHIHITSVFLACGENDSERLRLQEKANPDAVSMQVELLKSQPQVTKSEVQLKITEKNVAYTANLSIEQIVLRQKDFVAISFDEDHVSHFFVVPTANEKASKSKFIFHDREIGLLGRCMQETCEQFRLCLHVIYKTNSSVNNCLIAYELALVEKKYQLSRYVYFQDNDNAADFKVMTSKCDDDGVKCLKAY